jgi:hypothetical protein
MFISTRHGLALTDIDSQARVAHGRAHEARSVTFVTYSPPPPRTKSGWRGCDNLAISQMQHEREAAHGQQALSRCEGRA